MADVKTGVRLESPLKYRDRVFIMDAACQGLSFSHVGTRFVLCCVGEILVLQHQDLQCGQISTAWFYFLFPCKSAQQPLLYFRHCRKVQCLATLGQVVLNPLEKPQPSQDVWEWNRNSTTLFWLWFASYESDEQIITHHCYIRNIGSLLEKALETGGFRTMKFQCSFLVSRSRDFLGSGAELFIAQLESVKEQGLAPNPPSCSLFTHPTLAWQKSQEPPCWDQHLISVTGSDQFT